MEKSNCQELFTLTIEQFARTIEMGIPLEALFVMECIIQGTDPSKHIKEPNLAGINQLLTRKDYLFEGKITPIGIAIYESLRCGGMAPATIKKSMIVDLRTSFDLWWIEYPLHDGFVQGGITFDKTRTLRQAKTDCFNLFVKNVSSGPYTAEQIINATKAHVSTTRSQSVKERKNKMTFMQNTATYLRNKTYEAWIGDSVNAVSAQPSKSIGNTTIDI